MKRKAILATAAVVALLAVAAAAGVVYYRHYVEDIYPEKSITVLPDGQKEAVAKVRVYDATNFTWYEVSSQEYPEYVTWLADTFCGEYDYTEPYQRPEDTDGGGWDQVEFYDDSGTLLDACYAGLYWERDERQEIVSQSFRIMTEGYRYVDGYVYIYAEERSEEELREIVAKWYEIQGFFRRYGAKENCYFRWADMNHDGTEELIEVDVSDILEDDRQPARISIYDRENKMLWRANVLLQEAGEVSYYIVEEAGHACLLQDQLEGGSHTYRMFYLEDDGTEIEVASAADVAQYSGNGILLIGTADGILTYSTPGNDIVFRQ